MARRETVNRTGISGLSHVNSNDVWVVFPYVKCGEMNYVNIGPRMLTPLEAMSEEWECKHCHYVHSVYSDLPGEWEHWDEELLDAENIPTQRFWKNFFTVATEKPESYWDSNGGYYVTSYLWKCFISQTYA